MLKQRGILERRDFPIQILQPLMDSRIAISNGVLVRLEQRHVDRIETHDGDVKPDVDFGNGRAVVERPNMGG